MDGLSKFKRRVKCTSAILLAALITSSCAGAALVPASAAEVEQTPSESASMLSNEDRGVIYANSRTDFRDESIYFLITTRFYDGDPSNNATTSEDAKANAADDPSWRGDFKGLIDKLDYIKALGFTAIWITPVVENNSGYDYHGYHAYDFSAVDTRYESNGVTYQTLIDACHAKGMKVIQDIVLNHTCNWGEKNLLQIDNPVYGGGRSNYVMAAGASLDPENIYHHNGFCGGGDWDNQEAQKKTIADDCFDLNTENPKVYNYLVNCYTNYINMGVDAFRIDTVKHISRLTFNSVFLPAFKQAGGDKFYMFGEICTKGSNVWYRENPPISTCFYTWADDASWTGRWSNSEASNTALLDEHYAAHMDMGNQPTSTNAFLNGNDYHMPDYSMRSGMDAIDFQMHWDFISADKAFRTALGEDRYFNDSTWNVVYVDSHDYSPDECQTVRYVGDSEAWAENLALMFSFRGIPCIYYGSEIEFQKGKTIDKGPELPLKDTGRAYYGDHIEGTIDTSDFTVFGNVTGEVGNTLNYKLAQHIIRLNRIRQAVPALRKGQYSTEGCEGSFAFKRRYTDANTDSFACVCISGGATFSGVPNGTYVDAVTGDVQTVSGGTLTANCSGKGNMRVYVLNTTKTSAPGRVIPNGEFLTDGGAAELIGPVPIYHEDIDATGITLDQTTLSLTEGAAAKLNATIAPANCTKKTVTWTSSNPSVASVSGGTVTAVGIGTTKITATTHNGFTATCTVTVKEDTNKPTGITLDKTTLSVEAGSSASLTATVQPANASNKTVTWTSNNTSVATVNNGTVTGVSAGTATITAATSNGIKATCTVTVTGKAFPYIDKGFYFEKPSGWGNNVNVYFFNKSSNTTVGTSWPGTAMTNSGDGIYTLDYTNTDSNVVMIFNDGGSNQSPLKDMGGFEIKDQGYYTSSGFDHIVQKETIVDVASVSLNKTSLTLKDGSTSTLTATVSPSNATNQTITWTSSNPSVATVNSNGVVTGVYEGSAVITATSNNGKTATCNVTVVMNVLYTDVQNTSTVSATSVQVGNSIKINGSATDGTAPYTFSFYYKKSGASSWTAFGSAYTTATTATLTPSSAGTFNLRCIVKDAAGKSSTKDFTVNFVNPNQELANKTTVSATSVNLGKAINITGSATGGSGNYIYEFYYKKSGASSWSTFGSGNRTATTATLKPSSTGTFYVRVYVKDSNGNSAVKDFTLKFVNGDLTNNCTASSTSPTVGSSVTIKGGAAGGSGSYTYEFYYKKSGASSWSKFGSSYLTATTATLKASSAGTFVVRTYAKDSAGKSSVKDITITFKNAGLTNNSTVTSTTPTVGNAVTIKGAAAGGAGSYTYEFYYKKSGDTSWSTFGSSYRTATTATLKASSVNTFTVRVYVKDAKGTAAKKDFTISFKKGALTNNTTVTSTTPKVGNAVTIKGAAAGGTGSGYTYEFYYKKSGDTSWSTFGSSYRTATTATLKASSANTFTVRVYVKDSAGTAAVKDFTIKFSK